MVDKPALGVSPFGHTPSVTEVGQIAALPEPVIRNLQITQCYYELSTAFIERTGPEANWCTFATWASKQAGQTIRREDLSRTLEALFHINSDVGKAILLIANLAKQLGAGLPIDRIRQLVWKQLTAAAVEKASNAVGRGNKKVFEEIAREFARFMATCLSDTAFDADHIEDFCRELRPGNPPNGQQYLRQAFTRYYQSLFEADPKKRHELRLLANLEIGFHEQTRLQPEIAESLAVPMIDPKELKRRILEIIFPEGGWLAQMRISALELMGRTVPLDKGLEALVILARGQIRQCITAHLMTITLPPDLRLRLGHDLTAGFPEFLKELNDSDLIALLQQIDPTPDSLRESGAVDWANLSERLHFIADLFRCYHASPDMFSPPFFPEQVLALKSGKLPIGRL